MALDYTSRRPKVRCMDCKHANIEQMICTPNSEDCEPEYKLDMFDLTSYSPCDFFEPREMVDD